MWEHIVQDPERAKTFNYAMEAQTQASLPTVGIYPFESELGGLVESDDAWREWPVSVKHDLAWLYLKSPLDL